MLINRLTATKILTSRFGSQYYCILVRYEKSMSCKYKSALDILCPFPCPTISAFSTYPWPACQHWNVYLSDLLVAPNCFYCSLIFRGKDSVCLCSLMYYQCLEWYQCWKSWSAWSTPYRLIFRNKEVLAHSATFPNTAIKSMRDNITLPFNGRNHHRSIILKKKFKIQL